MYGHSSHTCMTITDFILHANTSLNTLHNLTLVHDIFITPSMFMSIVTGMHYFRNIWSTRNTIDHLSTIGTSQHFILACFTAANE